MGALLEQIRMDFLDRIRNRWRRRKALVRRTRFGTAYVYDTRWRGTELRVLELGGVYQSATFTDERWCYPPFPYLWLFDKAFECGHAIHSMCMLGGGGYAYPKHVIAHHAPTAIDVVEVDPTITDIAREFFFLDRLEQLYHAQRDGRLNLICADGLSYLKTCIREGKRYDALLNDCFAGSVADSSLAGVQAARLAHRCLSPDGLYLTNVISSLEGPGSGPLWDVANTLGSVFASVLACPAGDVGPADTNNVMVIASDLHPHIPGALTLIDTASEGGR